MKTAKSPDDQVLSFIHTLICSRGIENAGTIRGLFMDGYCYHFAIILNAMFNRGTICIAYPFGHIVWLDGSNEDEDIAYDADGVVLDYEHLIPTWYLQETIEDFMHVPGKNHFADADRIRKIYDNYCSETVSKTARSSVDKAGGGTHDYSQ